MSITRTTVAERVGAYLHGELPLAALVEWAEDAMQEGVFDDHQFSAIRQAVARLGLADVRAFGLTWEDCEQLLRGLGYLARVDIVAA
jgi:hypothetical protein